MSVRLTVWDGAGVIGGNKVLLEADGRNLFFDFGTAFATMDAYFDEFLGARGNRGLLDLIELNILPPLDGIYRHDLYPPDGSAEDRMRRKPDHRSLEIHAVLASHAHVDHNGAISALRPDVPVHCSPMTAFIAKAMQDCGGAYPGDVCYVRPRRINANGLIGIDPKANARHRPYILHGNGLEAAALEFWSRNHGKAQLDVVEPRLGPGDVEGLPYQVFGVDHSVLGATAFAVQTSAGWVAYTGDLRLHGASGHLTRAFAQALSELRPAVLITEGTHLEDLPGGSEHLVRERALAAVRAAPGFVAADFQPRHVERLITFRDVARETGRRLAILVKDAYLLDAMRCVDRSIPTVDADDAVVLYARGKVTAPRWEQELLRRFSSRKVDAAEVRAYPEAYLLALSFYELAELVQIDPPPGGIWIHSSSEAYDEEGRVNWERLRHWLEHFGMRLVGDWQRAKAGDPEHRGFHASGHVSGPELASLVDIIRPRLLIPVHTEQPGWFRRFEGRMEVLLPERGRTIDIAAGAD